MICITLHAIPCSGLTHSKICSILLLEEVTVWKLDVCYMIVSKIHVTRMSCIHLNICHDYQLKEMSAIAQD
jgi:hypothetical protein